MRGRSPLTSPRVKRRLLEASGSSLKMKWCPDRGSSLSTTLMVWITWGEATRKEVQTQGQKMQKCDERVLGLKQTPLHVLTVVLPKNMSQCQRPLVSRVQPQIKNWSFLKKHTPQNDGIQKHIVVYIQNAQEKTRNLPSLAGAVKYRAQRWADLFLLFEAVVLGYNMLVISRRPHGRSRSQNGSKIRV